MQIYTLISATSAAVNVTSVPLQLNDLKYYSIEITFSGSNVTGTLTLEASNGGQPSSTWVTITGSSQPVTLSTDHLYDVHGSSYRYVRVVWTAVSGTGNISAIGVIKENPITQA